VATKRTRRKIPADSLPYGKAYQDEAREILPQLKTASEAKLYFALLTMRNAKSHRTKPVGTTLLSEITGLDPQSIKRARKSLKEKKLISTAGGRGRGNRTTYRFCWLPPKDEIEESLKPHEEGKEYEKARKADDEYDDYEPFALPPPKD
jgi:hypothetical protein